MGRDVIDFNKDDATPTNTGQAIVAIDPAAFGELDEFKSAVDRLVRDLRASERLPGVERIWMPGEQSHLKRAAQSRDGIAIAPALRQTLARLAADIGIEPLQENP
jgi:LDH2 family malate/lactate/ureidoglycolate dehydrogenase